MDKQGDLFEGAPPPRYEAPKQLTARAKRTLALFKNAEHQQVTVTQLMGISPQYNGAIFELRNAGYNIKLVGRHALTGITTYRLDVRSDERASPIEPVPQGAR